jgi:hypothetical protein
MKMAIVIWIWAAVIWGNILFYGLCRRKSKLDTPIIVNNHPFIKVVALFVASRSTKHAHGGARIRKSILMPSLFMTNVSNLENSAQNEF